VLTRATPRPLPAEWLSEADGWATVYVFGHDDQEALVQAQPFKGWMVEHVYRWPAVTITVEEMTWQLEIDGWGTDSGSWGAVGRGQQVRDATLTVTARWAEGS
jgi:hypothetical protein